MNMSEEQKKEFMSAREKLLKKKLIALLKDDGKGHHYPKFAKRLENFDVNIVYLSDDPNYTASISFDDAKIRIGEGFLLNKDLFYQLNVLMRHELAHNLMMHQIRMMNKFRQEHNDQYAEQISASRTLHTLLNYLEDFEISNKRYTENDKTLVRNMLLNGRLISGLVTEDHRKSWKDLSLEEMYDHMQEEFGAVQKEVRRYYKAYTNNFLHNDEELTVDNAMTDEIKSLYYYRNKDITDYNYTSTNGSKDLIADFINNKAIFHFFPFDTFKKPCIVLFSGLPDLWQKAVKESYNALAKKYTSAKADAEQVLELINDATPTSQVDIIDNDTGEVVYQLVSPEEKLLVGDMIRYFLATDYYIDDYNKWYKRIVTAFRDDPATASNYSKQDLQDILNAIK